MYFLSENFFILTMMIIIPISIKIDDIIVSSILVSATLIKIKISPIIINKIVAILLLNTFFISLKFERTVFTEKRR